MRPPRDRRRMARLPVLGAPVLGALVLAACTPTFNWREVPVDDGALTVLFPCKPEARTRTVMIAGEPASMQMLSCAAGGATFAASVLGVTDPARVPTAIEALRSATVGNLAGAAPRFEPFTLRGATPNPLAARLRVEGQLPDGRRVEVRAAFFVHGLHVYQVSVVGTAPDAEALASFMTGLKLAS